jgi:transglutaminase-like putative cysteine protease
VSGYIVADTRRNLEPRGVAASHAWVEAYTPTHGWRGFEPTNNLVASEFHVKMAVGRDYADVAPTRGTYRGQATEILSVAVQTHVEA